MGSTAHKDPPLRRARVLLVVALVLLLAILLFGDDPWTGGIAERLAEGQAVRPVDFARIYGWWTAAANAVGVVLLLATTRRWRGPTGVPTHRHLAAPPRGSRWSFRVAVAAAVLTSALLGWPRLSQSLWDDERYMLIRAVDGSYVRKADGAIKFHNVKLRDTLWHFTKPTNHVPYSVVSRLTIDAWRAVARPRLKFVSEPVYRLPAFLAGLASIAVTAGFLRRLGFARAGVFAAWILALHPWHMRYTTEARSYAFLFAAIPGLLWLWLRALERGSWGRWLAFGAAQAGVLWCWTGSLVLLVLVNLSALAGMGLLYAGSPHLPSQLARWLVASLAGAMVWAQLMVPNLAQLAAYLGQHTFHLGARFMRNVLAFLFAGVAWRTRADALHYVEVADLAAAHPALFYAGVASSLALIAFGTVRLARIGDVRGLLGAVLLGAAPLTWVFLWLRSDAVFEWYFVFAVPLLATLAALGLDGLFGWVRPRRAARAATIAAALVWLAAFAWWTQDPRRAMRAGSVNPERESVLLTRPTLDPFSPENAEIITASFERGPRYYDPLHVQVSDPAGLQQLMHEADRRHRALYVNLGRPLVAEHKFPELFEMVSRDDLFEEVAHLYGLERRGHRVVYRYRRQHGEVQPGTHPRLEPVPAASRALAPGG
jgi:hypothetical protein